MGGADETMTWTSGSLFAVLWVCLFLPFGIWVGSVYYKMAHLQPIKSRSPTISLMVHSSLLLYMLFICAQRLFASLYPCWLSLIQGFLGLIIIGNLYIARCITLYAQFYSIDPEYAAKFRNTLISKFIRKSSDSKNMLLYAVLLSVFLLLPAFLVVFLDENSFDYGDACVRSAGGSASLIYVYAILYFVVFVYLTIKLRTIFDAFRIKEELLYVGLGWIFTITFWIVFNYPKSTAEINAAFPISALLLLIGISLAITFSTIWSIHLAIYQPQKFLVDEFLNFGQNKELFEKGLLAEHDEESHEVILRILKSAKGYESFEKFATSIYSVEPLLYWKALQVLSESKFSVTASKLSYFYEVFERYLKDTSYLRIPVEIVSISESETIASELSKLSEEDAASLDKFCSKIITEHSVLILHYIAENIFNMYSNSNEYQILQAEIEKEKKKAEIYANLNSLA
jgi:hypothetical protein